LRSTPSVKASLEADGEGNYAALVEHESEKSFMAMHLSDEPQKAWAKVEPPTRRVTYASPV
jgi:hypothetical protein